MRSTTIDEAENSQAPIRLSRKEKIKLRNLEKRNIAELMQFLVLEHTKNEMTVRKKLPKNNKKANK